MDIKDYYRLQAQIYWEISQKNQHNPDIRDYFLTLSNEAEDKLKKYERSLICQM